MVELLLLPFKLAFMAVKLAVFLIVFVVFLMILPFVILAGAAFLLKCIF